MDMRILASHRLMIAIMAALLPFLVGGCGNGGGDSTSSTPVATTPAPTEAVVELSYSTEVGDWSFTTITVRESGGLGLSVNWVRVLFSRLGPEEYKEYGASTFINSLGTNRLEANQEFTVQINEPATRGFVTWVQLNYTDDAGNQADVVVGSPEDSI